MATLVAWNLAALNGRGEMIEVSESIPEYRMKIVDCMPKSKNPPATPEGLFDQGSVMWVATGFQYTQGNTTYGTRLQMTMEFGTIPPATFSQLHDILQVVVFARVRVQLFKYDLSSNNQTPISIFDSNSHGWNNNHIATVTCDRWSGLLSSSVTQAWAVLRSPTIFLGGIDYKVRCEMNANSTGDGTTCAQVDFLPNASFYKCDDAGVALLEVPVIFDPDRFSTKWQSYRI